MKRSPTLDAFLEPLRGDRELIAILSRECANDRARAAVVGASRPRPTPEQLQETRRRMLAAATSARCGAPVVFGFAFAREAFAEERAAQRKALATEKP